MRNDWMRAGWLLCYIPTHNPLQACLISYQYHSTYLQGRRHYKRNLPMTNECENRAQDPVCYTSRTLERVVGVKDHEKCRNNFAAFTRQFRYRVQASQT